MLCSDSPGSGGDVSVADTPQFDKDGVAEGHENEEDSSPNDMAIVPISLESSCDDYRPENSGGEKGNWCYQLLFAIFIFNLSQTILSCIRDAWGFGKMILLVGDISTSFSIVLRVNSQQACRSSDSFYYLVCYLCSC